MARHRDTHDRILSTLALRPCPVTREDLIEQLGIKPWEAHKALTALHICGAVVRTRAEPAGGRPQFLWSLPNAKPIAPEATTSGAWISVCHTNRNDIRRPQRPGP